MVDAHGITAIDISRDIVTAIYIINISSQDKHSCRILVRIPHAVDRLFQDCSLVGIDVCHTTATIDVIDNNVRVSRNLQQNTVGIGHVTSITPTVKSTNFSFFQVPSRTDGHRGHVITTEDTGYLEVTLRMGLCKVQGHAFTEALTAIVCPISIIKDLFAITVLDILCHRIFVINIDADVGGCLYRHGITTAIDKAEGATVDLKIGTVELGLVTRRGDDIL